jgi:thiol-disulfide isomerase/thioredoxin
MGKEFENEEEKIAHEKKITGYLSMFSFLLTFLVGYYYGFHFAAILAAIGSLFIGYSRDASDEPLYKQVWSLASPFVFVTAVGVINPAVIPVGASGVLFTALGLHIKTLNQSFPIKLMIMAGALALTVYGSLVEYPKYVQTMLSNETFEKLPDFEVSTLDGQRVQLSSLEGKVVLMDFWATWCKPCRDEFVELEAVVKHYENNENVIFLITNAKGSGDTMEKVREFAAKNEYDLPFFIDETGNASSAIDVSAFPTLALIDKNGFFRIHHTGYSNAEDLTNYLIKNIDALLEEK